MAAAGIRSGHGPVVRALDLDGDRIGVRQEPVRDGVCERDLFGVAGPERLERAFRIVAEAAVCVEGEGAFVGAGLQRVGQDRGNKRVFGRILVGRDHLPVQDTAVLAVRDCLALGNRGVVAVDVAGHGAVDFADQLGACVGRHFRAEVGIVVYQLRIDCVRCFTLRDDCGLRHPGEGCGRFDHRGRGGDHGGDVRCGVFQQCDLRGG